jgi:heterodisulfide reductase subunit A
LFRETCEEAGVNKYLFEFANIRDQCSWVHMQKKEEATEKAKDLVRMAVAKAALLEPQEEVTSEVMPSAAVIGGGIAGMTAALSLANRGFEVHLVEKESRLGGMLLSLYKLFPTDEDSFESLMPKIDAVNKNEKIKIYTDAVVKEVKGYIGNYEITIKKREEESEIKVGTIIVATGATEFIPHAFYRYDEYDNVITQMELERIFKEKKFDYESVVMIQCVGARGQYVSYCSKICCMVAIKNAIIIKQIHPDADVYILHNDIQTYGTKYEEYYKKARDMGIFFIRYPVERRPNVSKVDEELHVRVYHERLGIELDIKADLVVLSTPLVQNPDATDLSKLLKVPLGQDKFFFEAHVKLRPVDFATDGIYLCGTAHGPEDIAGSVSQAYAAASRASIPLSKGFVAAEAITSSVDEDKCVGCGICQSVCPYGAIEVVEKEEEKRKANVTPVKCKGCGTCGSSCIKGAIIMQHFSDEQLIAQERAALEVA